MNKFIIVACLTGAALSPLPAAGNDEGGQRKGQGDNFAVCEADKAKFCGDIEPGDGRLVACMVEHEKDLSEECRGVLGRKKAAVAAGHHGKGGDAACEEDIKRLCGDVKPGEGRIGACMLAREAEVSEGCRSALAKKKEEMKGEEGKKKAKGKAKGKAEQKP